MNLAGDYFLAGARLARNQHCRQCRRNFFNKAPYTHHVLAHADEPPLAGWPFIRVHAAVECADFLEHLIKGI